MNWLSWLQDDAVPRDTEGPRGYLRLQVGIKEKASDYSDLSKARSLTREERMSKNATDEQLRAKMSQVVGNAGAPEHDFADWCGLKRKARAAFVVGGADAFEEDGIMAPDLVDLVEATRKRRKGNNDSEPEGGEEQPEEEGY